MYFEKAENLLQGVKNDSSILEQLLISANQALELLRTLFEALILQQQSNPTAICKWVGLMLTNFTQLKEVDFSSCNNQNLLEVVMLLVSIIVGLQKRKDSLKSFCAIKTIRLRGLTVSYPLLADTFCSILSAQDLPCEQLEATGSELPIFLEFPFF